MNTIQVKPSPALDERCWPLLKHPVSGGLLDAVGEVPEGGRPWLNDGITCRLLTEGAILRADHPIFAKPAHTDAEKVDDQKSAADDKPSDPPPPAPKPALPPAPPAKGASPDPAS